MPISAHTERAHALLSASSASRWIACPPSARLQESVPDTTSEYAEEGTLAHEFAEVTLRRRLTRCNAKERKEIEEREARIRAHALFAPEMDNAVREYCAIVEERFFAAKARSEDAVVLLEQRLDYSEWVPEGYGTGDVVLIADGVLEVIDLKFGKGVPVSAVGNPQIRLYGLGAWSAWSYLYDVREVHLTIVQPRLDSVSTDVLPIGELLEWAQTAVKPAAALADAGEGEFKPGDHCRFCKVKATCRARADENLAAVAYEFREPALMSDEEIGSLLFVAERLSTWAEDVQKYAFEQAKSGHKIPFWKLVEGRSNRAIVDKPKAIEALKAAGLAEDKYLKPKELYGIGDLEKHVGKKELVTLLGDLIQKPPGKPVLVAETDKRPELNSLDQDFAGETFEAQ